MAVCRLISEPEADHCDKHTPRVITHMCANTRVKSVLSCRGYSPQEAAHVRPPLISANRLHSRTQARPERPELCERGGGRREIRLWFGAHGGTSESLCWESQKAWWHIWDKIKMKIGVDSICSALCRRRSTCDPLPPFLSPAICFTSPSVFLSLNHPKTAKNLRHQKLTHLIGGDLFYFKRK